MGYLSSCLKIKRICKDKQYQLHKTHTFWFLGNRYTKQSDCYIETPEEVWAVKFFGKVKYRRVLVFKESGEYFFRSFFGIMLWKIAYFDSKQEKLPIYDFRFRYQSEWESKTSHNILLINPQPMEIHWQERNGKETIIDTGDVVYGMELESLPGLLKRI